MAVSLAHTFGQLIGNVLEDAIAPTLRKFAGTHGLYLDIKGQRTARVGKKVTWTDIYGNAHDLDFVLERGGVIQNTRVIKRRKFKVQSRFYP